jgi:hypothetical protein
VRRPRPPRAASPPPCARAHVAALVAGLALLAPSIARAVDDGWAKGASAPAPDATVPPAQAPAPDPAHPMDAIPEKLNVRGSFRSIADYEVVRYKDSADITHHGTDDAVNLIEYGSLAATGLGDPRLSAVVAARWQLDAVRPGPDSELRDLSDAEPARRHLKLLEAYGQARDLGGLVTARAGRQNVDGFEPVFLDGGRIDVANAGMFRGTAYGGYRASLYSGADDRPVFGAEAGARPVRGLDVVAGWFHYVADAYGLEARESPLEDLTFTGRVEGIGGGLSEADFDGRGRCPPLGLELRLGYTRWFENARFPYDYTFERAPSTGVTRLLVGARTDGNEGRVELTFDKVPHLIATAKLRLFRPVSSDRDPYNLAYEEWTPSLEIYDLPWTGLEADLRYTGYRADTGVPASIDPKTVDGFTDIRGEGISSYDEVGLDVSQRLGRKVKVGVGGLFRGESYEDRFGKISSADAWDAHVEARWLATDRLTVIVRYDYAQDVDVFEPWVSWDQRVRLEIRYAF